MSPQVGARKSDRKPPVPAGSGEVPSFPKRRKKGNMLVISSFRKRRKHILQNDTRAGLIYRVTQSRGIEMSGNWIATAESDRSESAEERGGRYPSSMLERNRPQQVAEVADALGVSRVSILREHSDGLRATASCVAPMAARPCSRVPRCSSRSARQRTLRQSAPSPVLPPRRLCSRASSLVMLHHGPELSARLARGAST